MATIQARKSRGHKYWYIVESRRINGKPRPVTLAYLGKAEDLLKRLKEKEKQINVKSFAHGDVAALLKMAEKLNVVEIINDHLLKKAPSSLPLRHGLGLAQKRYRLPVKNGTTLKKLPVSKEWLDYR